ncbi:aminotransferase class I/II-fold pyridoxal phosphate-dependent enzyme [Actinomyces radicidentis]|uniref:MalY/PatB family protein n=1 Tax=Actinomyces radicidentis TaxID=111015 RepID=UPI0028ED8864|nr:aminotransferase class I/II-fold pyridoxal phosphate-dependent enzyme [Actinomyces radicidentis]
MTTSTRLLTPLPDDLRAAYDALTPEALRARGSLKWSQYGDAIGAWVAEMDLGTAPAVTRALRGAVDDAAFGYMPPAFAQSARKATAAYQADSFGWDVPVEDVSLLPDVLSSLRSVIQFMTEPGSTVIVPTPAYMPFLSIPGEYGRELLEVPALRAEADAIAAGAPEWSLDLGAIETAMANGAGLLVLCNPWNPVGRVLTADELDAVAALSSRYGVPVFADEIHSCLVLEEGLTHVPYASRPGADPALTWTATAASKGWNLPGLRCAQLIASGAARKEWEAQPLCQHLAFEAAGIGALATSAALSPEGRAWNEGVRAYVRGNRDLVAARLADVEGVCFTAPAGTYLSWLDCSGRILPEGVSPMKHLLREAGVATNDGATFGAGYESFVRLNLATGRGVEEETVSCIATALEALPLR